MSFFKFNKPEKVAYPWSQKKSSGPALPRYGHVVQDVSAAETFVVHGGIAKGSGKKDIFMFDPGMFMSLYIDLLLYQCPFRNRNCCSHRVNFHL